MTQHNPQKFHRNFGKAQGNDWADLERELGRVEDDLSAARGISFALLVTLIVGIGVAGLALYLY